MEPLEGRLTEEPRFELLLDGRLTDVDLLDEPRPLDVEVELDPGRVVDDDGRVVDVEGRVVEVVGRVVEVVPGRVEPLVPPIAEPAGRLVVGLPIVDPGREVDVPGRVDPVMPGRPTV